MLSILSAVLDSFKALNPVVTILTGAVTFALALFNFFNTMWAAMVAKLATVVLPSSSATLVVDAFSFANYVYPVSEMMTMASGYCVLLLTCTAVRIIKSFIPTIA